MRESVRRALSALPILLVASLAVFAVVPSGGVGPGPRESADATASAPPARGGALMLEPVLARRAIQAFVVFALLASTFFVVSQVPNDPAFSFSPEPVRATPRDAREDGSEMHENGDAGAHGLWNVSGGFALDPAHEQPTGIWSDG